jgi:hypothetical protein
MDESASQVTRHFLRSFSQFRNWLRGRILRASSFDQAVRLARFYGEVKHVNSDGIYFDDEVENHIYKLYEREIAVDIVSLQAGLGSDVVIVGSELYDSGGHTAALMKWLLLQPGGRPHRLVVTRSLTRRVEKSIRAAKRKLLVCNKDVARAVGQILSFASGANTLILHIHPDDIIAATAARILQKAGYRVIFYNHADHCFSYGIRFADQIAEIGFFGQFISERSQRAVRGSCWLGIPVDVPQDMGPIEYRPEEGRVIMACGSPLKFRPSCGLFFGDFIDSILSADPAATVTLVGPSGEEAWWSGVKARWGKRLWFTGTLPRKDYLAVLSKAKVFIDGFPLGGGTSFIEAVMLGKLCTGLAIPMNGYSHSDVLRVRTIDALVDRVKALLNNDITLIGQALAVKSVVEQTLGVPAFAARIEAMYRGDLATCVNPFDRSAAGDTRWYEADWEQRATIHVPTAWVLHEMPFSFRLTLLWHLIPAIRYVTLKNILHIIAGGLKRNLVG